MNLGQTAFDLVERLREHSPTAANALLGRVVPLMIPLAGGLGVKVLEVDDRRAVLSMPVTRRTRNHLGSMYFGAQMTLADLAAGVLLFRRFPPGPYGGVIKRVEADFLAKAKGTITCVCTLAAEGEAALEAARTSESGKAEAWVDLELTDDSGQVATRVRFLAAVKRFAKPGA